MVDRIELEVNGGRAEGLPRVDAQAQLPGRATRTLAGAVLAADDRMIGTLRFRVE